MRTRSVAITILVGLTAATALQGYALFGPRWTGGEMPYYVNPANADRIAESAVIADVQAAAMAWTTQSNAAIVPYYIGKTSGATIAMNNRSEVFFRNASKNAAAATTYWWADSSNRMLEADIVIWDATYTFFGGSSGCSGGVYLRDLMTHEFGHALGLAHSSVSSATMYPVINKCSMSMRSLDNDDLAGIEKLYPAAGQVTNSAPAVAISSPVNGASVVQGAAMTFNGSASDKEDGNLTGSLVWTSSRDGRIGSGGTFSRALSAGSHTITATVTDRGGLTASRQVGVTVITSTTTQPPPAPGGISLSGRGYKVKGQHRVDLTWSGATTSSVYIHRDGARVLTSPNNGRATDSINARGSGTYAYRLCEVGTSTCSPTVHVVF